VSSGVAFALVTMVAWGVWLILADFASEYTDPVVAAAITYAVSAVLAVGYVLATRTSVEVTRRAWGLSVAAGVTAAIGLVSLYVALSRGSTATVSTVSALYFVFAAVLGVALLGEPVTPTKAAGIGLAVVAIVLIQM